jgi:ketosteroid isomerase-like protein
MDRRDLEAWLPGYVRAWTTNDPADIAGLFTEDAEYYTAPYRQPWRGRDAIVAGWLQKKDEEGEWKFRSEVLAIADDLGFVRGWTDYVDESYSNLWVIRLRDGRCSEFTEWWMKQSS